LIGQRYISKLVWTQLYDASQSIEEEDLRMLLGEIKKHILKNRIKSGSARKFLDGKLLFHEIGDITQNGTGNKIFCLFTQEMQIGSTIKKSLQEIAHRGGAFSVYSAKRFFSEMVDLISNPEKLENREELPIEETLKRIENFHHHSHDVNELGKMISLLNRSAVLDQSTLELIYVNVFETINALLNGHITSDPDEFLDAAYIVARRYQQINNFHLALELYKSIIPVAQKNKRDGLATICRIRISTIYKMTFPNSGEYIIEILSEIKDEHLQETAQTHKEIYYCILGFAYDQLQNQKQASKFYNLAIQEADVKISSLKWIAEAYDYLGQVAHNNYYLMEAARQYLTAATIAFSAGDLALADTYRNNASSAEINTSYSLMHTAHTYRMEDALNDAEYRAWEALRYLVRSFIHSKIQSNNQMMDQAFSILSEAEIILNIPGKKRKNMAALRRMRNTLKVLESGILDPIEVETRLEELANVVDDNIPLPPPTFMLLTLDGRLILIGKIVGEKWLESDIQGVILSGILSAIMSLISEVSTGKTSLRTVDAGSFKIMIEQSENVAAVLLVDRDVPEFRKKLEVSLNYIDENYGEKLTYWDGRTDLYEGMKEQVVSFLSL
jgi:hypothetical protein